MPQVLKEILIAEFCTLLHSAERNSVNRISHNSYIFSATSHHTDLLILPEIKSFEINEVIAGDKEIKNDP